MNTKKCEKVIFLPEKPVREWISVEKVISDFMASVGHDNETIDYVTNIIRPVFMMCVSADGGSINGAVLMLEVAKLAVTNFELQRKVGDLIQSNTERRNHSSRTEVITLSGIKK